MTEEPLESRLRAYLARPGYEPQDRSAIARGMGVAAAERAQLRELLRRWVQDKKLLRLRGARLAPVETAQRCYSGTVRVLARGKRLFVPHAEGQQALAELVAPGAGEPLAIPISPERSMGCMEGDVVLARVVRAAPPSFRRRHKGVRRDEPVRWEARVQEVQERRHSGWVGTLVAAGRRPQVRGDGKSAPARIALSAPPPAEASVGMLVVVQPESYPGVGRVEARGRVVEVLGWPEDAGVDMAALIRRHALRECFPAEVLQELEALQPGLPAAERAAREDWTRRCVVTIDPPTARDFDDAISLVRTPEGWELAVHIADVSYYVRPGSATDAEARRRGNSTYLPDRVLPMLPPRLCDDLCSLVQGEERPTMLCHICFSPEGAPLRARLARAVICSRRRLDYPAVLALLEQGVSTGDAEVDDMLREASRLAQLLRARRFAAGALNLDMPELRVLLDEAGHTVGFETEESDPSHQLVEEFMLAANEQVACLLRRRALPTLYRVHEEPAADKWADFAHTLRECGLSASTVPSRRELLRALEHISGHPEEPRLKVALLRSMMRARYAPKALGHFGLAKSDYCHFTSPIRRYADLVVHRGVLRLLGWPGAPAPLPAGQLERLADHLSDTERQSAAAEQEATKLKILQYMEEQVAAGEPRAWRAVVCGMWAHGLAVEVEELQLRGYVPAAVLPRREGWYYEPGRCWTQRGGLRLEEGACVWVTPQQVDWESLSVEFRPVAPPAAE